MPKQSGKGFQVQLPLRLVGFEKVLCMHKQILLILRQNNTTRNLLNNIKHFCHLKWYHVHKTVFLIIAILLSQILIGCNNKQPLDFTMTPLASALGGYRFKNGVLPTDVRGEEYALYKIREVMETDDFCKDCMAPFEWDHSQKKINNAIIYYANEDMPVLAGKEEEIRVIVISKIQPNNGLCYCVDNNFVIYDLRPKKTPFQPKEYIGGPVIDLLEVAEIVRKKEHLSLLFYKLKIGWNIK